MSFGIYPETVRVLTDGVVLNTVGGMPTINGAFLGGIGVQLLGFQVQGGIAATTLPGRSNCTDVAIEGNLLNNGDIVLDHCDNASIVENVLNGGGIFVSFSGNLFFFSDNSAFGNQGPRFSLFMSSGAILIGNIARNNGGDGFTLTASDATLKGNRAIGNGEDGFRIGLGSFGDL